MRLCCSSVSAGVSVHSARSSFCFLPSPQHIMSGRGGFGSRGGRGGGGDRGGRGGQQRTAQQQRRRRTSARTMHAQRGKPKQRQTLGNSCSTLDDIAPSAARICAAPCGTAPGPVCGAEVRSAAHPTFFRLVCCIPLVVRGVVCLCVRCVCRWSWWRCWWSRRLRRR